MKKTFNFKALAAIWHGTPTLVPSESSIGKWLRTLPCADKTHAIVTLTGDVKTDKDIWKDENIQRNSEQKCKTLGVGETLESVSSKQFQPLDITLAVAD